MTAHEWVGVDPGPRYTGITAVIGRDVVQWAVVDREVGAPATYPDRVRAEVRHCLGVFADGRARVAVEDVTAPSPFIDGQRRFTRPADLIELARAVGRLVEAFPGAVLVRPGGHGHQPWGTYPVALMTPRERANAIRRPLKKAGQSSTMRHARSAYDVAKAAPLAARAAAAVRLGRTP